MIDKRRKKGEEGNGEEEKNAQSQKNIFEEEKPIGMKDINRIMEYERIHGAKPHKPMKIYVYGKDPYEELKKRAERIISEDGRHSPAIVVSPIVLIIVVLLFILAILD